MMYKNISTTETFPKTLVVRNTPDGMIWQIYHVKTEKGAKILAEGADRGGFQGVTLEDYQPNMEETFPNWQNDMRNNVELRLLEGSNKMTYLLNMGFLSIDEVLDYAKHYNDAAEAHNDEMYDAYYAQYAEEQQRELDEERELRDAMMAAEDLYGQDEFNDDDDYPGIVLQDQMLRDEMEGIEEDLYGSDFDIDRFEDPEYIIASTSYKLNETYVFEANDKGEILDFCELGGLCERHGHKDWQNRDKTVQTIFPDKYVLVSTHPVSSEIYHSLYKLKA